MMLMSESTRLAGVIELTVPREDRLEVSGELKKMRYAYQNGIYEKRRCKQAEVLEIIHGICFTDGVLLLRTGRGLQC